MASSSFDDSNWSNYFEITSDNTSVDEAVGDIMYDLGSDAPSGFWSTVQSDGSDVRVVNSAGDTAYSFELENFDTGSNTGIVFFDSQNLQTGSDTTWRIYYGNSGASLPADSDTLGAENVWNSNYLGVHHFQNDPSGTAPQLEDSTGNGNTGTTEGSMTSGDLVSGNFGNSAWDFDGGDDEVAGMNYSQNSGSYTLLIWSQHRSVADSDNDRAWNMDFNNKFHLRDQGDSTMYMWHRDTVNSSWHNVTDSISNDSWNQWVMRWDGTTLEGFKNATSMGTASVSDQGGGGGNDDHFADYPSGGQGLDGLIGEARFYDGNVSDNWISTHYNVQNDPTGFWTTGAEQSTDSPGSVLESDGSGVLVSDGSGVLKTD